MLFERLGIDDVKARIIAACNGTEYFLASLVAIFLIDRVGRRPLMLFGAVGQTVTMVLLAVLGSVDTSGTQVASAVLLFVFNSFFAIGWLGMTWLYVSLFTSTRTRDGEKLTTTCAARRDRGPPHPCAGQRVQHRVKLDVQLCCRHGHWPFVQQHQLGDIHRYVVCAAASPSLLTLHGTVFAALNAFIVPVVYFFFPETAGRSLEDMDVVFAVAYNEKVSPVKVSLRKDLPPAGSPEADEILGITSSGASAVSRNGTAESEKH